MKTVAIIMVSCLCISLVPVTGISYAAGNTGHSVLTLDVCNTPGSDIRCSSDIPSVCECPCRLAPAGINGSCGTAGPDFYLSSVNFPEDRPPESL